MTLAVFATIWFVHLLAAISPGPAVLLAARTGMTRGARAGVAMAAGLGIGACVWAAAAMFGLRLVFDWAPGLLTALRLAGAGYLVWLAIKMWRHAAEPLEFDTTAEATAARGAWRIARAGLATQLANPKPAVFFGAVFASLVPPHAGIAAYAAVLVAVFLNEFLWNALVARVFSAARVRAGYQGLKSVIDRAFGGLLAALGVKLALS